MRSVWLFSLPNSISAAWQCRQISSAASFGIMPSRAWERAIKGDFAKVTLDDQVTALQALAKAVPEMDLKRVGITGWSFGGYMSALAVLKRPDVFKAAVAGGVVSDLVSEYGSSDDGPLMARYELGGTPWEAFEQYAAMSPLTHVEKVTTPTLVLHGQDDLTCPVGQAQQWHTSLRQLGVPTELVLYPGASHVFILLGRGLVQVPPGHAQVIAEAIIGQS